MRRLIAALLTTLCLSAAAPAATADTFTPPPDYTAEYEINKGPLTLGRATLKFARLGTDGYLYRLYTRPTGMASLFTDASIRERSRGRITEDGFRPEQYVYNRTGDDRARRAELTFDWERGRVHNDVGDHPWNLRIPEGTLDRVVSPLQLMHDLTELDGRDQLTYRIADGGELKTYTIHIRGEETVETPAGRFRALKVVRTAEDGDRETRLWCAPALSYLAVKVEQWEADDGSTELLLTEVSGLDREIDPPG